VLNHSPNIMTEIGRVARLLSGARTRPMMPAVATITVLLPPANACATASTTALRLARRSSIRAAGGSAIADIKEFPAGAPFYRDDTPFATARDEGHG
jgi:hypothetical protein